jgi:hypothetical protein
MGNLAWVGKGKVCRLVAGLTGKCVAEPKGEVEHRSVRGTAIANSRTVVTARIDTASPPVWRAVPIILPLAAVSMLARLQTPAYSLGRDASANLNVGLLDDKAVFNRLAAAAAKLGREHPLAVGLGELVNRDDAGAGGVGAAVEVAAVTRAKAYAPSSLYREESWLAVTPDYNAKQIREHTLNW